MKVLTDREIFGNPYERTASPPPYEDWELQGKHSKIFPTSTPIAKKRSQKIEGSYIWKALSS